jgi:hypothetical protein
MAPRAAAVKAGSVAPEVPGSMTPASRVRACKALRVAPVEPAAKVATVGRLEPAQAAFRVPAAPVAKEVSGVVAARAGSARPA